MSGQENIDLVRRYFDAIWNGGHLERESEFIAKDVVVHQAPIPGIPEGIGGPLAIVGTFRAAIPNIHTDHNVIFNAGDKVVQIFTSRGIHNGADLFGFPPSGKELVMIGVSVFRIEDGIIVERWGNMDILGLLQQLGAAPASPDDLLDLQKGWYM